MAAPPPSRLDGNQVLQHSFEDATGRIRVDAEISLDASTLDIVIDHTNDSIRLGDGVNLVTTTTNSGKVGLDVNISGVTGSLPISINTAQNPTIINLDMPIGNSEYSFNLPADTKQFKFRARNRNKVQYSYAIGETDINYISVMPGFVEEIKNIELSGSTPIYFRATASETIELIYWI